MHQLPYEQQRRSLQVGFNIDGKLCERAVSGPLTVNHGATAMRAALDGIGLVTGWRESMADAFDSSQLVEVLKPYWASFPGFYAYYPHRTHLPLKTRIFLDFLIQHVQRNALVQTSVWAIAPLT